MNAKQCMLLVAMSLGMVGTAHAAVPPGPQVTIENFTFKPAALKVHVGTTVMFKNADDIPHSVVMADGSFHSKALDTDDTTAVTFTKAGEFSYFCGLHPHMQGTVSVVP